MRIERVRVPEFGPLRDVDLELAEGLNLIFGRNEAGKTTLLDVVLSRLFRWERRRGTRLATVMGDVDRFGDPGEATGSLSIRLEGEVVDYPGGPSLLHHLELEHAGLAGLFCVRSGELEFPETETGEFWAELKKVLSGLPRGVDTLRETAHAEAGLTPTGQLSDAGDPGRKTRLANLRDRRERLEDLEERLPDAADYEERIARLEERKEALERGRRRRVADLSVRRRELIEAREETRRVPASRLDRWRERGGDRRRLEEEVEALEEDLAGRREILRERRSALVERKAEAEEAAERAEAAREAGLAERAREWSRDRERHATGGDDGGRSVIPGGIAAGVGIAAAALEAATGALPGSVTAVLVASLVLAGAGAWLVWRGRRRRERREERRRRLERRRDELLEESAALGLEVESAEELPAAVRGLEDRESDRGRELDLARERVRSVREQVEEKEEELESRRERLREAREELEDLREELGFDSLEAATAARERREELESELESVESALTELAGPDPESRDVSPPDGEGEVPEWDPSAWSRVERELDEARSGYEELQHEFVRAGLSTPEDVLTELRECRSEIREIEVDRDAGLLAGEIFGSMDEALEERLRDALSREGDFSVAGILEHVTERYVGVSRDGDGEETLTVRDREGRRFPLEELSRGTRDQVYLSLRIGLAGAALEAAESGGEGFLLLDDAFLTADWERRERMVEAVRSLAERGWQVVYLTCDTHLRELFEEAGARVGEL